jgi:hypothetical protein
MRGIGRALLRRPGQGGSSPSSSSGLHHHQHHHHPHHYTTATTSHGGVLKRIRAGAGAAAIVSNSSSRVSEGELVAPSQLLLSRCLSTASKQASASEPGSGSSSHKGTRAGVRPKGKHTCGSMRPLAFVSIDFGSIDRSIAHMCICDVLPDASINRSNKTPYRAGLRRAAGRLRAGVVRALSGGGGGGLQASGIDWTVASIDG